MAFELNVQYNYFACVCIGIIHYCPRQPHSHGKQTHFLFFSYFMCISQGQYMLMKITVKMPELDKWLVVSCSPWPGVKLGNLYQE